MYKLTIVFKNGKKIKNTYSEKELRVVFKKKFKQSIRYATVLTPSGVVKDVTKVFDPFAY